MAITADPVPGTKVDLMKPRAGTDEGEWPRLPNFIFCCGIDEVNR